MNKITKIEVRWDNRVVGHIVVTRQGLCAFEYSAEQLTGGISISPFDLPCRNGSFIARPRPFDGNFGVFDDCLPDGWGLLIQDRYLRQKGINPHSLSILDRLALVGKNGRGALEFYPDRSTTAQGDCDSLDQLASEANEILSSDNYSNAIEEFVNRGGSPGGARPKIFLKQDDKEWLVKFRAKYDPQDIGRIEYFYSLLAKQCGIEMPTTQLFDGKYFGVERFDRVNNQKLHVVSVAGLLSADYRIPSIDYLHIFKCCSALTHNVNELWKVFRLMAFNYLIGNNDDHAKNFSFIYRDNKWNFAPAYDLLPGGGINGYRSTSINDSIVPTDKDLIEVATKAGLDSKDARSIFDEMKQTVNDNKL